MWEIWRKSINKFLSYTVHKQTNYQTNKQINRRTNANNYLTSAGGRGNYSVGSICLSHLQYAQYSVASSYLSHLQYAQYSVASSYLSHLHWVFLCPCFWTHRKEPLVLTSLVSKKTEALWHCVGGTYWITLQILMPHFPFSEGKLSTLVSPNDVPQDFPSKPTMSKVSWRFFFCFLIK